MLDLFGLEVQSNTATCMRQLPIGCKFPPIYLPRIWQLKSIFFSNGVVPLAFQLQDQRLIGQAKSFLDYVLDHQQADGWIGPELPTNSSTPRIVWPRYLVLLGLIVSISSHFLSLSLKLTLNSNMPKQILPRLLESWTLCIALFLWLILYGLMDKKAMRRRGSSLITRMFVGKRYVERLFCTLNNFKFIPHPI